MAAHDEFERFRQIAERSSRNNLSTYDQSRDAYGRRVTYGEFLENPYSSHVKRASSFREKRNSSGVIANRLAGSMSTSRSPASPLSGHSDGRLSPYRRSVYEGGSMSGPNRSREYMRSDEPESPRILNRANILETQPRRERGGSMKDPKNFERAKAGYRPSAPAAFSSNLSPSNVSRTSRTSSPYSNKSADENMVKVRRFTCKKDGQIVSKDDHRMPQKELFPSAAALQAARQSINYLQSKLDAAPTIYTDENSSESNSDENDVVEIPAITTTLVQSNSNEEYKYDRSPVYGSPHSLRPEFRSRSKSWAFVHQPEGGSPQSSPKSGSLPPNEQQWTVQVLGIGRVGKTSLCLQFQTSESLDIMMDNGTDDEETRTVVVEVNGEHFNLEFIDTNIVQDDFQAEMENNIIETADAYVVVYAIDDRASFLAARAIVNNLLGHCKRSSAIVLAANKSDLVRTRAVSSEEGKNLAAVYSCPYFETSTSLNHRVDELLVGIVVAIKEQRREIEKERERLERLSVTTKHGSFAQQGRRRSSLSGLKAPTTNSVVKFFQKHFKKKSKS